MRKVFLCAVLTVCMASAAAAGTMPKPVDAVVANDIVGMEALRLHAERAEARQLAEGAILALRRRDRDAIAVLSALAGSDADEEIRAVAGLSLSSVYLRQGRFSDCFAALQSAQALRPDLFGDNLKQTMMFAKALRDAPLMRLERPAHGVLPIARDKAGMVRVDIAINGGKQDAVIDSGAGFSTVTRSVAERLGMKMLDGTVSVGTATEDVQTRLAIADRLEFGGAVLRHVVFIVLPDAALTFADGAYKIEAIVGLPVFVTLGRIAFARDGDGETMEYGAASSGETPAANMILDGVQPYVLIDADKTANPLRLFVDTGADHTHLEGNALADHPGLAQGAIDAVLKWGGAGGVKTDEHGKTLPELTLKMGGRTFVLKDVPVHSSTKADREGDIGQDLLLQGKRFTMDFEHMVFAIE